MKGTADFQRKVIWGFCLRKDQMLYARGTVISKLDGSKEMTFYSDMLFGFLNKAVVWAANNHQISGFHCHWLPAVSLQLSLKKTYTHKRPGICRSIINHTFIVGKRLLICSFLPFSLWCRLQWEIEASFTQYMTASQKGGLCLPGL